MNNTNSLLLTKPSFMQNTDTAVRSNDKLRVVTFNYLPSAYQFVSQWIQENGHDHILAATSPGIKTRATPSYQDMLPLVDKSVNTIVTSKIKSVLTPLLRQLQPDIILCFTFAHKLDAEICQIPTYGAVNIHPSILPAYRGPNPIRQFYDGAKEFGVTAHRIEEGYDTGEVLSIESEIMPEFITRETSVRWGELIKKCIASGMENAISGKSGIIQDHSQATYAPAFTEEEKWVNLNEPSKVILRKTLALNLAGGQAKAMINGKIYKIHSAHYLSNATSMPAGSVIKQEKDMFEVATIDGVVKLVTEPFDPNKKYCNVLPRAAFFG